MFTMFRDKKKSNSVCVIACIVFTQRGANKLSLPLYFLFLSVCVFASSVSFYVV